jgi:hemerythrin-like domain-containing protein
MNPIQKLMTEHQSILKAISIIESKIKAFESDGKIDTQFIITAIDFIRNYADKYHHAKEEDILFVQMGKAGFPIDSGPIAVMLHEHDEGRGYVANLEAANTRYSDGILGAADEIIENAMAYSMLLRGHIQKEDNVLYPMAIKLLGESVIEQMSVEFERVDREFEHTQSKYLQILASMSN